MISNQLSDMNSEKFAVVFDTNSYRNIIRGTSIEDIEASITQLKEREARKNIMAKATPWLVWKCLLICRDQGKVYIMMSV
jgi:hypothetical protein